MAPATPTAQRMQQQSSGSWGAGAAQEPSWEESKEMLVKAVSTLAIFGALAFLLAVGLRQPQGK